MRTARHLPLLLLMTAALTPGVAAQGTAPAPQAPPTFVAPKIDVFKELRVISGVSVTDTGDLVFVGSDAKIHRTDASGSEKWPTRSEIWAARIPSSPRRGA